jgi:trimeric autotransporter adhesin
MDFMRSKLTFLFLLLGAMYSGGVQAQYMHTFAGNGFGHSTGSGGYTGDNGYAAYAELNSPTGVCFDGAGNVYIADRANNVVRKVNTVGIITTFAGNGTLGYSGDKGLATAAQLNKPYGVAADVDGNIYISDNGNNTIRKVSITGVITTYAGKNSAGYTGDGGAATAARLNNPQGIVLDNNGNLYIADAGNHAIRMVDAAGGMSTIAGTGSYGYTGDGGPAFTATLHSPSGVAVDLYGNIYIADYFNNVVRKIDAAGDISTFAGTGNIGFSGDGGNATSAKFHFPSSVSVYGFGNVYIADEGNNAIRMVDNAGKITTIAGTGTNGYSGDGGLAVVAELSSPKTVSVDGLNRLYIADYDNNVIRQVSSVLAVQPVNSIAAGIKTYPNPSNGSFVVDVPAINGVANVTIIDVLGRVVEHRNIQGSNSHRSIVNISGIPAGSYILKVNAGGNTYQEQVKVK